MFDCQACGACCELTTGRCPQLRGVVGQQTACAIYANRPDICRIFTPGSIECLLAREVAFGPRAQRPRNA
jgi:Fe-S-cluster containining protein